MSILDKVNVDVQQHWYRLGNRIAWWDSHQKLWTTYLIDIKGNQISDTDYAVNKKDFLEMEKEKFFDTAVSEIMLNDIRWNKFAFPGGLK